MEQAFYCNQCMSMAYCEKNRVCLQAQCPWPDSDTVKDEQAIEVYVICDDPQKEIINNDNADQYGYLSTMGGQTIALLKKATILTDLKNGKRKA